MPVLEKVNSIEDLKTLSISELTELCEEIRALIVATVANNGGHLASSLGAVELTVALGYLFNPPKDKIIWDVGHQCYAYKILTGRKDRFDTLRCYKGLSGFPNKDESIYDSFTSGHSSTSISWALGLACARDLAKTDEKIIAVIGDGSLTAGLALEGINNAGHLEKDMIVILNDNEMSISENVGALSSYLSKILTGDFYTKIRKDIEKMLNSIPALGIPLIKVAKKIEEFAKSIITPGVIFEELGFKYVGPVNGHNLPMLIETLKNVKKFDKPVLLHVYTKKGKGYKPAEDNPELFHGVPPFDIQTGIIKKSQTKSYTDVFGETLFDMAMEDPRVVTVTAAMRSGTGLKKFASNFKERFFDVGIAEQHAVSFSAGLARAGFRPYVAIYSTFLQRSIDMIIHDVCLQNLPVVFAVDRAGFVGEDGPTHHGQFDISYLRYIPNLVVCAASDGNELEALLKSSLKWSVPCAIRYPRGTALMVGEKQSFIGLGKGKLLKQGENIAIVAVGTVVNEAVKAAEMLLERGLKVTVFNAIFVKPLDEEKLEEILTTHSVVFAIEENSYIGGFGSAVKELKSKIEAKAKVKQIAIPDFFVEHAPANKLREKYGLTAEKIAEKILLFFENQ